MQEKEDGGDAPCNLPSGLHLGVVVGHQLRVIQSYLREHLLQLIANCQGIGLPDSLLRVIEESEGY